METYLTESITLSIRKAGQSGLPYIATHDSGDAKVSKMQVSNPALSFTLKL